jgi:phage terminase large subunit GpA-like protein
MRPDLEKFRVPSFTKAATLRSEAAAILEPPPDLDVAQAAERYRHLYNPGGGYNGPWRNVVAPYLVAPMQALTDPRYPMVVFVAPAQSGKTEIGLNFAGYAIEVDPSDFQIVLPEKQLAEDFSARRIGRMVDASPHYAARLSERKVYAARFDRCIVNLSWPTSSNASSKPVPRNWLDERDSMGDDVGGGEGRPGEGDPVKLYDKRSQTFGTRRKTLVTSSPKRPPVKGAPDPLGRHEAPATTGSLALYNEGTRKQLYWPCQQCGAFFVTRTADLHCDPAAKSTDRTIDVWFACPDCGGVHREADRRALWAAHEWRAEDEHRYASVDSYWLFGPQAAFITLEELVRKRLTAEETRQRTGSDTELRAFWNIDAGEVYRPDSDEDAPRAPEAVLQAAPDLELGVVPDWAEVLTASVDVQKDRFEIAWTAYGPGNEAALIDVQKLVALDQEGRPVLTGAGNGAVAGILEPCDPATRLEHWRALIEAVFDKGLPLAADRNRVLRPACVAIDTGGKAGVTDKAYAFARWLKRARPDLVRKAMLLKGRAGRNPVRVMRASWDPKVNKRGTNRRGVDLWTVYTDELKDATDARLRRAINQAGARGPDTLHVSRNLPSAVFDQLCAETRNEDGEWENVRQVANEAWDLAVYAHAAWIRLKGEAINWARPPAWARASEASTEIAKPVVAIPPSPSGRNPLPTDRPPVAPAQAQQPAPPPPPRRLPRRGGGWLHSWRS